MNVDRGLIAALAALLPLASATGAVDRVPAAVPHARLDVVRPVVACPALAQADIRAAADTPAAVRSAERVDTPKGAFCKVVSQIDPAIVVTTYLPAEHWTQRYYQAAGVVAGPTGYPQAGTCQPALNGEFAYASSNQRFTMVVGDRDTPGWTPDPQKRIDYAYRANHVTALVSKALIRIYYGQAPRYSYFMGCSEGGREALIEAQRFPDDFDGIGAGAPGLLATAQESTFHIWKVQANRRADGTNILLPDKLRLLHDAVIARCETLSGVGDGLLQDPSACAFRPAAMRCAPATTDTAGCFTAEEVAAIDKLYEGARDPDGTHLYWGLQRGSELAWNLPRTADEKNTSGVNQAVQLAHILLPESTPALADPDRVAIGTADFRRAAALTSLFDAGNTDLRAFARRGGKLVLWHGLSDIQIPAPATIAYYRGVRATVGAQMAQGMMRAFLLPGVGHCGGGDGYDQIDVLSALMAWVERDQAPTALVSGKRDGGLHDAGDGPGAAHGDAPPTTLRPYATPMPPLAATRPVYPFPSIARYTGKGDPARAANYVRVARPASYASAVSYLAADLIGPDNQHDYVVADGRIIRTDGAAHGR